MINYSPETPNHPSGLRFGLTNQTYIYSTNTTDPDGDLAQYGWDRDDNSIADIWTDFYDSGETVSVGHIWTKIGIYSVKVKARDEFDAENLSFNFDDFTC